MYGAFTLCGSPSQQPSTTREFGNSAGSRARAPARPYNPEPTTAHAFGMGLCLGYFPVRSPLLGESLS